MDKEQRQRIGKQIGYIFSEIRSLAPPTGTTGVSGFLPGSPIYDSRISMELRPFQPTSSVEEFHKALIIRGHLDIPSDKKDEVMSKIHDSHERPHRICLTHGDLHPGNILLDENLQVTGVIDWESAAWMPEYWYAFSSTANDMYCTLSHALSGKLPRRATFLGLGKVFGVK